MAGKKTKTTSQPAPNGSGKALTFDTRDRLLVLLLLKLGASQAEIAAALGVTQPTISRLLGGIRVRRIETAAPGEPRP